MTRARMAQRPPFSIVYRGTDPLIVSRTGKLRHWHPAMAAGLAERRARAARAALTGWGDL